MHGVSTCRQRSPNFLSGLLPLLLQASQKPLEAASDDDRSQSWDSTHLTWQSLATLNRQMKCLLKDAIYAAFLLRNDTSPISAQTRNPYSAYKTYQSPTGPNPVKPGNLMTPSWRPAPKRITCRPPVRRLFCAVPCGEKGFAANSEDLSLSDMFVELHNEPVLQSACVVCRLSESRENS